jgi:hypothetical protein
LAFNPAPIKTFSTKFVYHLLDKNLSRAHKKWIWKAKIPLEFMFFLWRLYQDTVLTKDNMWKIKWLGSPKCSFFHVVWLRWCGGLWELVWTQTVVQGICGKSFAWLYAFLPRKRKFFNLLAAAICWAI